MARPADLFARQALLDGVVEYLAAHGLADTTLRPMATALGTTATRLLHHFGSKEQLVTAALHRVNEMLRQVEALWLVRNPGMTQSEILRAWWKWVLASKTNENLARLGIEASILDAAMTGVDASTRRNQLGAWRENIQRRVEAAGVAERDARTQAAVLEAGFTGLLVDYLSGGDRAQLTAALGWILEDHERRVASLARHKSAR